MAVMVSSRRASSAEHAYKTTLLLLGDRERLKGDAAIAAWQVAWADRPLLHRRKLRMAA